MIVVEKIVHEGTIQSVSSGPMGSKNRVYHAKLLVAGRKWEEREKFTNEATARARPSPFVNSLEMQILLPTTAVMPSPAQRVYITVEFLPPEE